MRDFYHGIISLRRRSALSDSIAFVLRQEAGGSTGQLASGGAENGLLAPPHNSYTHHGERARAMSASGKVRSFSDDNNIVH